VHTFFVMGALIQIVLTVALPLRIALLPAAILGLHSVIKTISQSASPARNDLMHDVIPSRTSAQLPIDTDGRFGSDPAAKPVLVFHFGMRVNHPLGLLAPGASEIATHFEACNDMARAKADEYGILGQTLWRAAERGSNNTLMIVFYFRDIDALNRFAHDDIHRKAWDWGNKAPKHIGFFHESFCVPAKAYETIYVNFHPLLMGATSVKCEDEEGGDKWVRPIVSANHKALRSQFGRMGREDHQSEKY
jgi:fumagillin biosynthesis monooxygenase